VSLKDIAKLLPGIRHNRKRRYEWNYFSHSALAKPGRFCGVYHSFDCAREEAMRRFGAAEYDDPSIVGNNVQQFMTVESFDWPILYYLAATFDLATTTVFDVGGHIGVKYYAFREYLCEKPYQWRVIETPSMVDAGKAYMCEAGDADNLKLTTEWDPFHTSAQAILFCSGSLQYIADDLGKISSNLGGPDFLLLNKVPLTDHDSFVTLDNLGKARVPYRIFNKNEWIENLTRAGYVIGDSWTIPHRDFEVPFSTRAEWKQVKMMGFYCRREG
jgi:putative methyltransferase (TIGR04325 family)